jgi:hypothetical protein
MPSPYATTISDLGTALRMSTMVTPRKSPLVEAIDAAIKACREDRSHAYDAKRFGDICEALDKLHEARSLAAGGRS